jgi:heptosyltransferase II
MLESPGHILLVRLSSVGDILLSTPVAASLRARYPKARLTWLLDAGYEDLIRHNPNVDRVVTFDYLGRHRGPAGIRLLAEELRPVDVVVDLQNKVRSVLLSMILRPEKRLALVKRKGMDVVRAILGQDPIFQGPHQLVRNMMVINEGAAPDPKTDFESGRLAPLLRLDPKEEEAADQILDRDNASSWIGVIPGSRHRTKQWPVRHVAALSDLCCREGFRVVLLGGGDDALLADRVSRLTKNKILIQTGGGLGRMAALISRCRAIVSPDSGPAHMAWALGVPVAVLFGPTSPDRWGPKGPLSEVVRLGLSCSPCSNHGSDACRLGTLECMEELQPLSVVQAVKRLIDLNSPR